jgi:hypothetical protein
MRGMHQNNRSNQKRINNVNGQTKPNGAESQRKNQKFDHTQHCRKQNQTSRPLKFQHQLHDFHAKQMKTKQSPSTVASPIMAPYDDGRHT